MGLHVGPQVGPISKLLATVSTPKRFLPGVASHVPLQKPRTGESLATDLALVREGVGEDMHGQGWHAHIQLVADVASLGSLWGQLPVGLLVPGQVGAGGKLLSTFQALVLLLGAAGQPGPAVALVQRVHREGLDALLQGVDREGLTGGAEGVEGLDRCLWEGDVGVV